jgi:hypothetical protein
MKRTRSRNYANCVFLINMIRSGLANTRIGGGFEEGYPHQRNTHTRDDTIRPYVDKIDTGFGKRSDISFVIPTPVSYNQIFTKKATPDERLYLLKLAQQGTKQPRQMMGRSQADRMPPIEAPPIPYGEDDYDQPVKEEDTSTPIEDDSMYGAAPDGSRYDDEVIADMEQEMISEAIMTEELIAEDVVYAPPHEETYEEEMQNVQEWIDQAPVVNVESKSSHDEDDILVLGENSFGGDVMITQAEPTIEIAPVIKVETQKEITINGIGPRRQTDSNRLKAIQQSARQNAFNANRTQVPEREKVAQWKTREERLKRRTDIIDVMRKSQRNALKKYTQPYDPNDVFGGFDPDVVKQIKKEMAEDKKNIKLEKKVSKKTYDPNDVFGGFDPDVVKQIKREMAEDTLRKMIRKKKQNRKSK